MVEASTRCSEYCKATASNTHKYGRNLADTTAKEVRKPSSKIVSLMAYRHASRSVRWHQEKPQLGGLVGLVRRTKRAKQRISTKYGKKTLQSYVTIQNPEE